MLLKKITLLNIRSYKDKTEIAIPKGRVLFQGDIGSGKSTILSAVEFALFGLGDVDGSNLLRSGEKNGSVLLEFQVNDKNYQIFRRLIRRGNNKVSQDEGYIVEGDSTTSYSVSEMKPKILKIININERAQTRTTSIIYRFAIFTPQEMMKQILSEIPEKRVEILRRAFNIEEYISIKKNTQMFLIGINGEIRLSSEITKDLQEKENLQYERKKRFHIVSCEIEKYHDEISGLNIKIAELKEKMDKLRQKEILVLQLQASIPHLNSKVERNQQTTTQVEETLKKLEQELQSINSKEIHVKLLKPVYDDYLLKKDTLKQLASSAKLYDNAEKEKIKLEQSIENVRKNLEVEIERLTQEKYVGSARTIMEENSLKKQVLMLELNELTCKEEISQLNTLREEFGNRVSLVSKHRTEAKSLEQQISKKQKEIEKIISISENPVCPTCKQKLSNEHILRVKSEFEQEKSEALDQIGYLKDMISSYEEQISDKKTQIENLDRKQEYLKELQHELGKLSEKKNAIENEKKILQLKESKITENLQSLHDENYSFPERKKLTEIISYMAMLAKDKELFTELEQTISKYELAKIEFAYIENLQEIKRKQKIVEEIEDVTIRKDALKIELSSDKQNLLQAKELFCKNKDSMRDLQTLQEDTEKLEVRKSELSQMISGRLSELNFLESNLTELEKEVRDKKNRDENKQILQETSSWLEKDFIPAVEDIERYVLQSINEEFNQLFQRWFSILVETSEINVEVDANFTPIISQGGYSLIINSLSGGEKTSVALAYRLALNTMLRKFAAMSNTLLILDEPTDGFGKEQLIRLGHVLDELDSAQIIMVSHERELEAIVDTIYRVTKVGLRSKVELAAD